MAKIAGPARSRFIKSLQYVIMRIRIFCIEPIAEKLFKSEKYNAGLFTLRLSENESKTTLFNITAFDCDGLSLEEVIFLKEGIFREVCIKLTSW